MTARIGALLVLLSIVGACLAAPFYAARIAGTDPFRSNVLGTVTERGVTQDVLAPNTAGLGLGTTPIGPRWRARYLLGADQQGRDIAARLLYGGRTSLLIAGAASLATLALSLPLGLAAGVAGRALDAGLGWLLDMVWAFPVTLLAISLSAVLASQDLRFGGLTVTSDSLAVPVAILAVIFIPYVARPLRAEMRALAAGEFVLAATALGASRWRIAARHLLPHAWPVLVRFAPILVAFDLLTEATLSVLSVGVQPPMASWGTLLADGQGLLYTRPVAALAPGLAIVATVLALNVVAERPGVAR